MKRMVTDMRLRYGKINRDVLKWWKYILMMGLHAMIEIDLHD